MENMAERLVTRAKQLTTRRLSTRRLLQLRALLEQCEHRCLRKAGAAVGAESVGNRVAAIHFLGHAARYRRVARKVRKRLEQESGS